MLYKQSHTTPPYQHHCASTKKLQAMAPSNFCLNITTPVMRGFWDGVVICLIIRSIFWACLFLYVGYSEGTSNFCTQNVIPLKSSSGLSESDPIQDPLGMLGPGGHIVSWFRVIGVVQVVVIVLNLGIVYFNPVIHAILMICDHIFQFVYMAVGINLYISGVPHECVDFKMGNNVAYTFLMYISISNIFMYSIVAFFICIVAFVVCYHVGSSEDKGNPILHLINKTWGNSPESSDVSMAPSDLPRKSHSGSRHIHAHHVPTSNMSVASRNSDSENWFTGTPGISRTSSSSTLLAQDGNGGHATA